MRYYRAYEINSRPFLLFELVADSIEELQELELDEDPLVVTEDQLINPADPNYISYEHGICHWRIFNGELEERPAGEITAQATALGKATEVLRTKSLDATFEVGTFTYDSRDFPLTSAARAVYDAVFEAAPANRVLISTTGNYTLLEANIGAFKTAYLNKVLDLQYSLSTSGAV